MQRMNIAMLCMSKKTTKVLMRILDLATNILLISFAMMFTFIGLSALFLLVVEGDFMNLIGVIAGFALAWICWSVRV